MRLAYNAGTVGGGQFLQALDFEVTVGSPLGLDQTGIDPTLYCFQLQIVVPGEVQITYPAQGGWERIAQTN